MKTIKAVNTIIGPAPGDVHLPGAIFAIKDADAVSLANSGAAVIVKAKDDTFKNNVPRQSKKTRKGR